MKEAKFGLWTQSFILIFSSCAHMSYFHDPWTLQWGEYEVGGSFAWGTGNFIVDKCADSDSMCTSSPLDDAYSEDNYEFNLWVRLGVTDFMDIRINGYAGFLAYSDTDGDYRDGFAGGTLGAGFSILKTSSYAFSFRFDAGYNMWRGAEIRMALPVGVRLKRRFTIYTSPVLTKMLFSSSASAFKISPIETGFGAEEIFVEIHGFVSFEYVDFERDGKNQGIPYFDFSHFYLYPEANIFNKVFIKGEIEFEHLFEEIRIDRAWIRYSPFKDKNLLNVYVGSRYLPFTREIDFYQPPLRMLVDRPYAPDFIGFHEFRGLGISLKGLINVFGKVGVLYDIGYYADPLITRAALPEEVDAS